MSQAHLRAWSVETHEDHPRTCRSVHITSSNNLHLFPPACNTLTVSGRSGKHGTRPIHLNHPTRTPHNLPAHGEDRSSNKHLRPPPPPPSQPSRFSTLLWTLGTSLLHSGLVIARTHEYAYGGHSIPRKTGVYITPPLLTPPGATFRTTILQGFTYLSASEIQEVIHQVSQEFLGTNYNLLTNNCNHFTSALCQRLTGQPAPAWLNRAAGIGLSLPCIVPREWIDPPDCETAEGALVDEEEEGEAAETSAMLGRRREGTPPARVVSVKDRDSDGREIPVAERAPVPGRK